MSGTISRGRAVSAAASAVGLAASVLRVQQLAAALLSLFFGPPRRRLSDCHADLAPTNVDSCAVQRRAQNGGVQNTGRAVVLSDWLDTSVALFCECAVNLTHLACIGWCCSELDHVLLVYAKGTKPLHANSQMTPASYIHTIERLWEVTVVFAFLIFLVPGTPRVLQGHN